MSPRVVLVGAMGAGKTTVAELLASAWGVDARDTDHDVEAAAGRIAGRVARTPLQLSTRLSEATGAHVYLKREDLQPVRSYKGRGAANLIAQLDSEQIWAGVVCASAGNHAQGVAHACATLGVNARIYLPANTPRQKRDRVAAIGGDWVEMVVGGRTYDDAAAAAGPERPYQRHLAGA